VLDYLYQIPALLFAIGLLLPTLLIAWEIGTGVSSLHGLLSRFGEPRTVALLSVWGLYTVALLIIIQLLPN
jgi:hypothetical protein